MNKFLPINNKLHYSIFVDSDYLTYVHKITDQEFFVVGNKPMYLVKICGRKVDITNTHEFLDIQTMFNIINLHFNFLFTMQDLYSFN